MAFNHRKMLVSFPPEKGLNLTIFIPCFQTYPPPPPPPTQTENALSLIITTIICILGSVLLFVFLVVFVYLHITQSRRSSAVEASPPGETNRSQDGEDEAEERDHYVWQINTSGLHRSVIDSIPVVGFKKGDGIINGAECSVCLNEFQEDESLRLLPKCRHAFHINCIDTWLRSHKNCPLCRAPVLLLADPLYQETESASINDLRGSRNVNVLLSRAQSDLANHCGSGSVETVRRSFSIGGGSSLKAEESDDVANTSITHFFSANFFSSSRGSRNQEPVLPARTPSASD